GPNCGDDADYDAAIYVDGALQTTLEVEDNCTFTYTVPATADELKIVISDDGGGAPYGGTAIWKELQSKDPNTPWPTITVTRTGTLSTPVKADKCAMFRWQWAAFYEGREEDYADMLNVDIGQIALWVDAGNDAVEVLYVEFVMPADLTGYGALAEMREASLDPGVRLRNGAVLPNRLTAATHYPMYVQGDYNSVAWKPAAVMGDAITMLSNAWDDDTHQDAVVIKTNAADTEYWFAVLAGHSATPCDHEDAGCAGGYTDFYGGGIENYLRFLERWSGETATYRGSLVSLHISQTVDGTWNGG
ncbi:MAG: hypothetical protein GWN71_45500, partial [Gammaproteobacteria bacterium]|nr:hypothetical protein [Gemmatimonadota bacterium]NIU80533.1 hypothetical protein [Gammaproteobacteria bacterium]